MANKGNKRRQKRMSFQGKLALNKKEYHWTFNQNPGTHKNTDSCPLGNLMRDVLHFADNTREIKYILQTKICNVNGRRVKDHHFSVGLFDIIEFKDIEKRYRVLITHRGFFVLKELAKDDKLLRPCKVVSKKIIKKGVLQLGFENGFVLRKPKVKNVNLRDTIEFDIVKQEFTTHIVFEKGQNVFVIDGPHASKFGELKEIIAGDLQKRAEVIVKSGKDEIRTIADYVFVIPKNFI